MTISDNRLDRIEALVEKNAAAIEQNSQIVEKVTEDIAKLAEENKELNIRFSAYQQASQWVVNLAFGLLATATITTIVTAVLK